MKKKIRLRDLKLKNLRLKRRQYRSGLIALGIFATVTLAFNFWFIDHAKDVIEQIVDQQSKGKLRLKVGKFRFNWIRNKLEFNNAVFYSTDSAAGVVYNVNIKRITVKANGFLPLLFNKQILIDSIHLFSPSVTLTRLQRRIKAAKIKNAADSATEEHFTVSKEMGRVAKAINDAINVLKINRFLLDDGALSLIDNTRPEETPFILNKIHIRLDGLRVDSTTAGAHKKKQGKILFTDDIAIQTHDQNLTLPGNRHTISFKKFKITLQDKRVEFDSCTIRGIKGDSSKTAFKVYFDSLRLTNINFDTLFYSEVIKADSVFAANPKIFLDIDADQKTVKHTKRIQRIDDLIQQLVGDIMLNYVVVQNGYINVNTIRKGKTSTFTSNDNDFELQGFQVRQNYEQPVHVDKFLMTLHNYQTSLQNGRYATSFDSIQFLNDAIYLTKFRLQEFRNGQTINDLRMPRFELKGLSWESLIYDNKFNAGSAIFINPDIVYAVPHRKDSHKKSIFQTLSDVGRVMNLDALNIRDGNILLNFHSGATLKLNDASLSVIPDKLTASKEVKNIQNSVRSFTFSKAQFKKNNVTAVLNNVQMDNTNGIRAAGLILKGSGLEAAAHAIVIRDLILDSIKRSLLLSGVRWGTASVSYNKVQQPGHIKKAAPIFIRINELTGGNTILSIHAGDTNISAVLKTIAAAKLYQRKEAGLLIEGLSFSGNDFLMTAPGTRLSADLLTITDRESSHLKNLFYQKINGADSVLITIPEVSVTPDISHMINGNLIADQVKLSDPSITGFFSRNDRSETRNQQKRGEIILGEALLERPKVGIRFTNKKNEISTIKWDGSAENSYLRMHDFKSAPGKSLDIGQLNVYLTGFEFVNNSNRKRYATGHNKLDVQLEGLHAERNPQDNKLGWNTLLSVHSASQLVLDNLGKKNAVLKLDSGAIRNIYLSSGTANNIGKILKASTGLTMSKTSGTFITARNRLQWHNLNFTNGFFKADSLELRPNQDLAAYLEKKAFAGDYLRLHTGAVTAGPVNTSIYGTDSILVIGGIQIDGARLLSVKDKTQPDPPKYKRLPADLILSAPVKLTIDSVRLSDAYAEYREINPKTRRMGIIPVPNLNARLYHIKNYNLRPSDSLLIYASADVIGALPTRLQVRESYTDTLNPFLMHVHTGPVALDKWNTVLLPLVGAKVSGGRLDSLNMTATGNNDYSRGVLQMYYRGLRLGLMNSANPAQQSIKNRVISWIANTFLLRKNNNGKISTVFFERLKDRSPINFVIKTTLSGVKSAVGLPGTKTKKRKYLKALHKTGSRE